MITMIDFQSPCMVLSESTLGPCGWASVSRTLDGGDLDIADLDDEDGLDGDEVDDEDGLGDFDDDDEEMEDEY